MDSEWNNFRQAAHEHANWIADYLEGVRQHPVAQDVNPGDLIRDLPDHGPEQGESFERILADFESRIFPRLTLWNHPRFYAYFSVSSTPANILAEMLIAGMNVNAMLWKASPAATELEMVTLKWLREWLGLSAHWFGIVFDTASVGVMQALGAARQRIQPDTRTKGMRPGLVIYTSQHTHNSAEKAAITLGFGQDYVRRIPVDTEYRMCVAELETAIQADIAAGLTPCCIVASVGSTSTAAVEPVNYIADIAERYGVWLHVDAAYGGPAAIVPEMQWILEGIERADSLVLNPHKWLFVSLDCSVLYTRHPELFREASALSFEALKTAQDGQVVNFMDYGVQLGRRFRSLKLWYVFRHYGREGLIALLRDALALGQKLKIRIEESENFELAAPVLFSLVCFRHRSGDDATRQILNEVNASGKAYLSHTVLNGRFTIRFAIGNYMTTAADIEEAWKCIVAAGSRIQSGSPVLAG